MAMLLVGRVVTVDDRLLVSVVVLHDHHLDTVTNVRQIEIHLFVTSFDSDRQNLYC